MFDRQFVLITPRDLDNPAHPAMFACTQIALYFPDFCPDDRPAELPEKGPYLPHVATVCPFCHPEWLETHLVSDPADIPDHTPVVLKFAWSHD